MPDPLPTAPDPAPGLVALPEGETLLAAPTQVQRRRIPSRAFVETQDSAEFGELRRRFRRFAFPMTAVFLGWYFAYVLLSVYARDFMSAPFLGQYFNVGHFLGLLQFASTFLITGLYVRHANAKLDPIASSIRSKLEGEAK